MSLIQELNLDGLGAISNVVAWSLTDFWHMFIFLFVISVGLGELVRAFEYVFMDIPFVRPRFSAYLIGDPALALAGALAVASVHRFDGGDAWYTQKITYVLILILSCLVAVALEVLGVLQNRKSPLVGFTWQQELLVPSKWIHTLAFGPILAILVCLGIHVAINPVSKIQMVLIITLVVFWFACDAYLDPRRVDPHPDPETLPEERTNKVYLFVKAHPHPSRDRQMEEWRERAKLTAAP